MLPTPTPAQNSGSSWLHLVRQLDAAAVAGWATVFVTLLAAMIALYGVWWQMRRQWLMNSAAMITGLADRFSSDEWRTYRRHSAAIISTHLRRGNVNLAKDLPVLGFFENLGHLVRRRVVDERMVWNKFGWYVTRYFLALTFAGDLIASSRKAEDDKTLWEEFEWLNKRMLRIYRRRGIDIIGSHPPSQRVSELLEQETTLTDWKEPPSTPEIVFAET
jgi:hypothetical protein